jgi:putative membrane protein
MARSEPASRQTAAVTEPQPRRTHATHASRLEDVGEPPDPRFSLANERTYLAWNRTAMAMVVGGAALTQLPAESDSRAVLRDTVAVVILIVGAALAWTSHRRWYEAERAMRLREPLPIRTPRFLSLAIAFAGVVGLILSIATFISER